MVCLEFLGSEPKFAEPTARPECLVLLNEKGLVKFKADITLEDLQVKAKEKTDLQAAQVLKPST